MTRTIERGEAVRNTEFGVFEEVSKLNKTLSWGPAGVEAILATLIPESESLFFGKMDVLQARSQYQSFEDLLFHHHCEVIRVKDLLVYELNQTPLNPDHPKDLRQLKEKINQKAIHLTNTYGRGQGDNFEQIEAILEQDANEYGEEATIKLNTLLSSLNNDRLPMANLLFGRDQSNVVGDTVLWSRMSKKIREPEVDIWKYALDSYLDSRNQHTLNLNGRLEGGDTIVHDGKCLIGVGGRTNLDAVTQVASIAYKQGLALYAIVHPDRASGKIEHQTTMHLDTFYMPSPKGSCVVHLEEARDRQVVQIAGPDTNQNGKTISSFEDFLISSGADIIPITKEQQLDYQANFVVMDPETVLVTKQDNVLLEQFRRRGIRVINGNLDAITQGYGGAHCSLTPILRS